MAVLPEARTCAVLRQIVDVTSLAGLLDLFGDEIDALGLTDGYVINLLNSAGDGLVGLKLRFAPEFHHLEPTYRGYKNPVSDDHLNARVYQTRRIERIDRHNATEAEKFILQIWKVDEIVGVPILGPAENDAAIGVIVLTNQKGTVVDEAGLQALRELTALFYRSLANWLRFSHLEEMQDQATSAVAEHNRLLEFLDEMSSLTAVDKIFEVFATEMFRQIPFDIAGFALVDGESMVTKKVVAASSQYDAIHDEWERHLLSNPYRMDPTTSGAVHVVMKNEPLLFPDVEEIKHLTMTPHDAASIAILKTARTLFISPIRYHKEPIGIMAFYSLSKPITLTEADLHLLEQLSSFLGTAVTNGKIYATSRDQNLEIGRLNERLQENVKELDQLASTDRLTGLFNYRIFEQELGRRLIESKRVSNVNDLSLLLIDIDRFKAFNDNHGHAAGNEVLAGVAREIGKLIRQSDTACRYGGEEFVIILPKCDLAGAHLLAERMRKAIESCRFTTSRGSHSITVSIGCAVHHSDESAESFFARADRALYQAKTNGRNQVADAA
jgi:two-component system cell cycle response regulator